MGSAALAAVGILAASALRRKCREEAEAPLDSRVLDFATTLGRRAAKELHEVPDGNGW